MIHKVVNGDTLSEIAAHYQVAMDDITRVNHLSDAESIRIGMELVIP